MQKFHAIHLIVQIHTKESKQEGWEGERMEGRKGEEKMEKGRKKHERKKYFICNVTGLINNNTEKKKGRSFWR